MKALGAAGAETKSVLPNGTTALIAAAGKGTGTIANNGSGNDRRGVALIDGGRVEPEARVLETVAAVLNQPGVDINAADEDGNTAVHSAASIGATSVVQLLADKGAQLNVKNKKGLTPLATLVSSAGRGRGAAYSEETSVKAMIDLLRKLGAVE